MRYLVIFYVLFSFLLSPINANEIKSFIKKNNLNSEKNFAIYVENLDKNKIIYSKNTQKSLRPASILKVLTYGASYLTLGENYKLETAFFLDNNDLYLKLGADTLLTSNDLNLLIKNLKNKIDISKIENFYIDDYIFDKIQYPSSWLEEDFWPTIKPITPYIIDNNTSMEPTISSKLTPSTNIDRIEPNIYLYI